MPRLGEPVVLRDVSKDFSARPVLSGITIDVEAREIVAIIGASGSGKSTLLRLIGGMSEPSAGEVRIGGTVVRRYDPRCAFAFQEARLFPWRTVAENVAVGLAQGTPAPAGRARVAELLELVGLSGFADHRPRAISGGMAQRASLARALARTPEVLLLDEPFGALDALTRLKMHQLLLDVHASEPTTVLFVTHDVDEALTLADTIVVLGSAGDAGATIQQTVRPEAPRPRNRAAAEFARLRHELLAALGVDTAVAG